MPAAAAGYPSRLWQSGTNSDALPKLDGCLARLPPTLTTLDLMNVVVQAKDFDEHSLKALRLRDCEIAEDDMIFGKGDGNAALTHLESAWGIETGEVPWPEPEEE